PGASRSGPRLTSSGWVPVPAMTCRGAGEPGSGAYRRTVLPLMVRQVPTYLSGRRTQVVDAVGSPPGRLWSNDHWTPPPANRPEGITIENGPRVPATTAGSTQATRSSGPGPLPSAHPEKSVWVLPNAETQGGSEA